MLAEEAARGAPAALAQHLEEVEIRIELRAGGQRLEHRVECDAMHVDAAVRAWRRTVRQAALIDHAGDEIDRAEFGEQRGVEGDLVDPVHDLALRVRRRGCLLYTSDAADER